MTRHAVELSVAEWIVLGILGWAGVAVLTALVLGPILRRLSATHRPRPVGSATAPAPSSRAGDAESVADATPGGSS